MCCYSSLQVHLIVAQAQRGCKARKSETVQRLGVVLGVELFGNAAQNGW